MPSPKSRKKGFFTIAQNTEDTDYVRMAYALALSLRHTQKSIYHLTIGITPGTVVDERYRWAFDNVVEIPWGDHAANSTWKLENEWKSIWMTPYEETIKLDADMLFFSSIENWWKALSAQDNPCVWTNSVLTCRGSEVSSDYYRKVFTENNLPNIYTGMWYFRKEQASFDMFELAKLIYWNWEAFFERLLIPTNRPDRPSTDVIFAIAAKLLDADNSAYRQSRYPTFTHMKSKIQGWNFENVVDDWREHALVFFTDAAECRIGHHRQLYPLHYHLKDFVTDEMLDIYERLVTK